MSGHQVYWTTTTKKATITARPWKGSVSSLHFTGYSLSRETCTVNFPNSGKTWCFHNRVFLCPDNFSWISNSVHIASELAQKDKCLSRQQTWKPNNGLLFFLALPIFVSAFHPNPLQFIVRKDDTDSLLKHCFCQRLSFPFVKSSPNICV